MEGSPPPEPVMEKAYPHSTFWTMWAPSDRPKLRVPPGVPWVTCDGIARDLTLGSLPVPELTLVFPNYQVL
ncbi:hypothetical protein KRMM14A1004_19320 [Krasilnikovia sp. MM14-A1004]